MELRTEISVSCATTIDFSSHVRWTKPSTEAKKVTTIFKTFWQQLYPKAYQEAPLTVQEWGRFDFPFNFPCPDIPHPRQWELRR